MKRPLLIWIAFAACAVTGFGVLGWFSSEMIRLERETTESRRLAAIEENVRLSLWRMDSALAAVHGLEAARPWQDYEAFHAADTAYSVGLAPLPPQSVLVPSPLLALDPPFVHLHIQIDQDGTMTSPQAPVGSMREAALANGVLDTRINAAEQALMTLRSRLNRNAFVLALHPPTDAVASGRRKTDSRNADGVEEFELAAPTLDEKALPAEAEQRKSVAEQRQRQEFYVQQNTLSRANNRGDVSETASSAASSGGTSGRAFLDQLGGDLVAETIATSSPAASRAANVALADASAEPMALAVAPAATAVGDAIESPLQPVWIDGDLFFAREITQPNQTLIQAVWLNWDELREWLLSRAGDLLPNARLEPAPNGAFSTTSESTRRLAFLPVRLFPGIVPVYSRTDFLFLRLTLAAAWAGAALAAGALALLLAGTLRLSERRGAFVSAVTHELRTPLTTFRMYTEMLSGGMVTDETKRRSYFETLRKEADRLFHLVENVLTYSRIERGRARRNVEETTCAEIIARLEERLRQRAEQGGLTLKTNLTGDAVDLPLRADITAVEQILFNLVDNAAKYAVRENAEGVVTISVMRSPRKKVTLRVADNGPGIHASVRGRLFKPFSKSAAEAAHSKPGVGLGLALSRRLARDELGGDLVLEKTGAGGTTFCLQLPLS